jgi:spermidine synthase
VRGNGAPFIFMGSGALSLLFALAAAPLLSAPLLAGTVYELTSAYHHIRVVDANGLRTLCFDDAEETKMSLRDPLKGHFEYTEYFHTPWLWNTQITRVLMIGLGGGSVQRSFQHYYPRLKLETVEIDPAVAQVARTYFYFRESESQKLHLEDGRVYLRRSRAQYDLIILDAYVQGRYGSSIPQHLATREFFELARDHLTTNGVVSYNVIGTMEGSRADIVGAIYRTLKSVFPQVYLYPARSSENVVLVATRTGVKTELPLLRQRAAQLERTRRVTLPGFGQRVERIEGLPPPSAANSPILTDDYAPVEGLAVGGGRR